MGAREGVTVDSERLIRAPLALGNQAEPATHIETALR
jgi:hypothetical protein